MKLVVVEHAPFEKLGAIELWAHKHNFTVTIVKPYQGEVLPQLNEVDFLVVLGGPQSGRELDEHPYLHQEIEFIAKAISAQKLVFGICLGAQLIGESLGAPTLKSPEKEVGVYPIWLTEVGKQDAILAGCPEKFNVTHWHNDMPGIPEGASVLAQSEGCPNQIIRFQKGVYGFQCHLEIDLFCIEEMIKNCATDLKPEKFVQAEYILKKQDYEGINQIMFGVLDRLLSHSI